MLLNIIQLMIIMVLVMQEIGVESLRVRIRDHVMSVVYVELGSMWYSGGIVYVILMLLCCCLLCIIVLQCLIAVGLWSLCCS